MNPRNARFKVIPRRFDGCVYAVELTNGMVKVGFSRNPRSRMASLSGQVARTFGADLLRFYVGANLPLRTALRVERELIERVGRIGNASKGRKEFFSGVSYGAAVTLVRQLARAQHLTEHPQ